VLPIFGHSVIPGLAPAGCSRAGKQWGHLAARNRQTRCSSCSVPARPGSRPSALSRVLASRRQHVFLREPALRYGWFGPIPLPWSRRTGSRPDYLAWEANVRSYGAVVLVLLINAIAVLSEDRFLARSKSASVRAASILAVDLGILSPMDPYMRLVALAPFPAAHSFQFSRQQPFLY
jgi:hypothetical protein